MEENSNEYKVYTPEIKEKRPSFLKNAFVPFCSSAVGTFLIIGVCFGMPNIRSKLLRNENNIDTGLIRTEGTVNSGIALKDYSNTAIAVANKVLPSIVGITVEYKVNTLFGESIVSQGSGSGIIVSSDGYILTNNHVVNSTSSSSYYQITEAAKVIVKLYNDENEYEATIVGSDTQTDLAVIKIDKEGLSAAELGDSDSVQVGEFTMAIGNPLGLQSSISCGIVSAKNRDVYDYESGTTFNLIQTDAAINSGNSGGALVNADGNVIGINTLKLSGTGVEGIGFAIPINSTLEVYNELKANGKISRPYIGIGGVDVDETLARQNNLAVGIYVKTIDNFSSAEKAGLQIGDVIIEADDTKVATMDELNSIKNKHKVGEKMTLKVNRDGKEKEIILILQEQ